MNSKRITLFGAAALVAVICLTATCPLRAEDLAIGVFLPLSGSNAVIGHRQKNAMLLAVDEVNRRGVISGERTFVLDIRNGGRRPEETRNIIHHFVSDKQYPIIISGAGSAAAAEAARLCQRMLTPLIIVTGSKDSITRSGFDYIFRIATPMSHYGDAAIEFVRDVIRPEKVALFAEKSEFGEGIMSVVRSAAEEERWDIVYGAGIATGVADLSDASTGPGIAGADTVFLAAFPPDADRIIKEIRTARFHGQSIVSMVPSSATENAFLACGEDCRGVFSSALWYGGADGSADSFFGRYLERYGVKPNYHAAQAYAAVLAAAAALRNVDTTNREAVRDSLRQTRIGSPLGTVSFSDWNGYANQNRPTTYLFQWFGDRFEVVWPEMYRTAEPIGVK